MDWWTKLVTPLQGAFNFWIYMRKRIQRLNREQNSNGICSCCWRVVAVWNTSVRNSINSSTNPSQRAPAATTVVGVTTRESSTTNACDHDAEPTERSAIGESPSTRLQQTEEGGPTRDPFVVEESASNSHNDDDEND